MKTCETFGVAHLNQLIVDNLHRIRALPFDVVVHIPRSGTIPASLIATYMARPLASVEEFCRHIVDARKSDCPRLDHVLLVDDSVRTGKQMRKSIDRILSERQGTKISTLAVYLSHDMRGQERVLMPDLFLHEHADSFYLYPWFMWKTPLLDMACVDMDGVLCRDATRDEDDDGPGYATFLGRAGLKFKPLSATIGWIVTGRLEKYRAETAAWLKAHGIAYSKLIMGPWRTKDERRGKAARWKAEVYRELPAKLFIESSESEARVIAEISGKTVWSVESGRSHG
jgi:orotate phosphoribosyltransferase